MAKLRDSHKGFMCLRSIRSTAPCADIPITADFDFAEALESVYPLLEIIFEYLDYKELKECSKVKPSWADIVEKVLAKRCKPSWFTYYVSHNNGKAFGCSPNINRNNVAVAIIMYDHKRIRLNRYICVHNNISELSRKPVPQYLEEELIPEGVQYCVISCPSVNSFFDLNTKHVLDLPCPSAMDGLFIPKIKNIRSIMFHCNTAKSDDIPKNLAQYIDEDEEVKCLLMFTTTDLNRSLVNFLKYLIPEHRTAGVAVGGGIIRGTKTFHKVKSSPRKLVYSKTDALCIVFLQKAQQEAEFNAYSFVVVGDDLSKLEFETELLKFKMQIRLRTHCVGIRICCSAKIEDTEECFTYHKLFPNIPLLSFNADGEIGWNCFSASEDVVYGKKAKYKYPKVQHQFSSVFVMITWGSLLPL